jgi:Cu2+-exporting ATPase
MRADGDQMDEATHGQLDAQAGHDAHDAHASHDAHAGHDAHVSRDAHASHDAHAGHNAHGGHDAHAGHSVAMFRDKFWLTLLLTIPIVIWSPDIQDWLGFRAPAFPGSDLIPAILGIVVFVYGGRVFIEGGLGELRQRQPGMMTLISLAIVVAFLTSLAATFDLFDLEIWWELSTLITIMLLGHWLEMRAIAQASGALSALAALLPDEAERIRVGSTEPETVPISELTEGDVVLVRPGGRVPADGNVVDGSADVDESMLTGESRPIFRETGDPVVAGSVVAGGSLRIRLTATGERTALSGIVRLVETAQNSASRAQALADRAAALLFYVALGSGIVTLAVWWLIGRPEEALVRTTTVLVISCPHALGLAIPLVISIGTSLGARNGLLVKDRLALERARNLDLVVFDKTGTLTKGRPTVVAVAGADEEDILRQAAAVEADSEHPLARAIVESARRRGLDVPLASGFEGLAGRGARASVGERQVVVGGPRLLAEIGAVPADEQTATAEAWARDGRTVLYVVIDNSVTGLIGLEDEIRPESYEAVSRLHELGVAVAMITGDSRAVAQSVARRLGIDDVAAEVLPADKADAVTRFKQGGRRVAMVGDGVNDAPALATADVGIAIGAGTDVAVESAGIVLVRDDPRDVVGAITLSRASYRKMIENLVWAAGYNLVAIPVAAGVLAPWGIELPMAVGAIAMSLSTIVVTANAQLMRTLRLRPSESPVSAAPAPA